MKIKKIICIILGIIMIFSCNMSLASSRNNGELYGTKSIQYIAITKTEYYFDKNSNSSLNCRGVTSVEYGNNANVIVELQKKVSNNNWDTIKTWTKYNRNRAKVDEIYYVETNNTYRLKITFEAYTENDEFIERDIQYSQAISL